MRSNFVRAFALFAVALFFSVSNFTEPANLHAGQPRQAFDENSEFAAAQTPEEFYRSVWQSAKDNFLWQDRLKDWDKWEHKFDGKLKTHSDAERAINQMLGSLNDHYTYYKDPTVTAARNTAAEAKNVVSYKMLPNDIGYIKIKTFGTVHASDEVEAALKALPDAKAYVLDLRDNGGGYIWQAFRVFALFADKGVFTKLTGQYGGAAYKETLELTATELQDIENGTTKTHIRPDNYTGSKPLVVLVNGDSASASEMLTGALKDNGRAKVVGTQTFGKGIAQITVNLERKASVQITFAQYFFPNGGSIHGVGIKPDKAVNVGTSGDTQLTEALKVIKEELTK